MERYTDMANLSFCLERKSCLIRVSSLEVGIVSRSLCVHEVEVEIVNSAGFKLFFKERTNVSFCLEEVRRQLVRQDITVAGVTACETGFECGFAPALKISVSGVEIVESRVKECVHHAACFLCIYFTVFNRQAHTSKSEVLFDFIHVKYSFPFRRLVSVTDGGIRLPCPMCRFRG